MIVELSIPTIIIVDAIMWMIIHMGVAFIGTNLPMKWFNAEGFWFKTRPFEQQGNWYKIFYIHHWKRYLPDGAKLFKSGFAKGQLSSTDKEYLKRFIQETCRGEAVHWFVIFFSPVFFLFNPPSAAIANILYAFIANLPCILAQRYNRPRLQALYRRKR